MMPDREKVIKAVEDAFDLVHSDFIGTDDFNETEWEQNKADALSLLKEQEEEIENLKQTAQSMIEGICLLKEQEAVEPKKTAYQRVDHTIACRYQCGTCGMSIFPSYKYCPFCGQAVKWDA